MFQFMHKSPDTAGQVPDFFRTTLAQGSRHVVLQRHEVLLPRFVLIEFQDYLRCGRLEYGFVRVKCDGCRHEHLVAFSCKRRGFCPSCGARRMIETSAHLGDHVIPEVPVRQWVAGGLLSGLQTLKSW